MGAGDTRAALLSAGLTSRSIALSADDEDDLPCCFGQVLCAEALRSRRHRLEPGASCRAPAASVSSTLRWNDHDRASWLSLDMCRSWYALSLGRSAWQTGNDDELA